MKTTALLSLTALMALPAWAADLTDEVKAAAQKLADKPNYSWTTKSDSPQTRGSQQGDRQGDRQGGRGRGRFGGFGSGTTEGKTDKSGFILLNMKFGTNAPTEAVVKGQKVAIKDGDEWKTSDELGDGDGGGQGRFSRGQMSVGRAQRTKAPAAEAEDLLGRVKELKKDGDVYSGEMTAEAVKRALTFRGGRGGGQGGGEAPDTSGVTGTVKFWVKDGMLSKYQTHLEGKMKGGRNNTEYPMNRTTTVEIKDAGSTKVVVPAEAKKKLSA